MNTSFLGAMTKAKIILLLLSLAFIHGYGQKQIIVSGIVRDTNGVNLPRPTIQLITSKDTLRIVGGEDGAFHFQIHERRRFLLSVAESGYYSYSNSFSILANADSFQLPPIILARNYKQLDPVTVVRVKPINIKKDTLEYSAAAYQLKVGAELERLMRRLPGIYWNMDGDLLIGGKKIERVMIDGQNFIGGDIKSALRNLPIDIIDKVQVIDDYGDKARLTGVKSGEPIKVLNIVLKEDKRNGGVANFEAGYGDKGRYNGILFSEIIAGNRQLTLNGKLANTSPSGDLHEKLIEMAYTDKRNPQWSSNADLSVWGDNHSLNTGLIQYNYFAASRGYLNQSSISAGSNQNELFSYSQTCNPNTNTLVRAGAFFGLYHNRESLSSDYSSNEQDSAFIKTDSGNALTISHSNNLATGSNFHFEKNEPHSRQKMSIDVSYRYNTKQQNDEDYSQTEIHADSLRSSSIQHYLLHTAHIHRELTARFNYYFPLGKQGLLELGYVLDHSTTQDNRIARAPDSAGGIPAIIDSLSSNYTFTTADSRIHAGYLTHAKHLDLNLGFDLLPGSQSGRTAGKGPDQIYHYLTLMPQSQLSYSISDGQKYNVEYSGYSSAPTLQQLQPVIDLSNPQYPVQGNPRLKPSYTHSAAIHYERSSLKANQYWGLVLGLAYKLTNNMIITNQVHPQDTSTVIQQTSYVNANGFYSLAADYRLDLAAILHKRLRVSAIGNIAKTQDIIMTDNIVYKGQTLSWNQGIQLSLNLPDIIESDLSGNYSHTLSRYSTGSSGSYSYPGFNWSFHNRHEMLQKWTMEYAISQSFTGVPGNKLQANPILMNASIRRDIFHRNQARISLSVNDMLNSATGITTNVGPTGTTQTRTTLIGRYFLFSILFKAEQFHKH